MHEFTAIWIYYGLDSATGLKTKKEQTAKTHRFETISEVEAFLKGAIDATNGYPAKLNEKQSSSKESEAYNLAIGEAYGFNAFSLKATPPVDKTQIN